MSLDERLERIRPCEHGEMEDHYTCDDIGYPEYDQMEHTNEKCHCDGGSRREITLNMTAVIDYLIEEFSITDMVDRDTLLAYAYDMELAALREPDPPASKKE